MEPHVSAQDWRHRARCRDEDPELFFPVGDSGPAVDQVAAAKAVCRRCPVASECLAAALVAGDGGVRGGLDEDERAAAVRRARRRLRGSPRTGNPLEPVGEQRTVLHHAPVVPTAERERVLCPTCELKVNVRGDDTIADHQRGHKPARARCPASETRYDRHAAVFFRVGHLRVAQCRCGEAWASRADDAVENQWRQHCEQSKAAQAKADRHHGRRQEQEVAV